MSQKFKFCERIPMYSYIEHRIVMNCLCKVLKVANKL